MATGAASTKNGSFYEDATLSNLQDWLIAIAAHTKDTRDLLERGEARGDKQQERRENEDPAWAKRLGDKIERGISVGITTALGQAKSLAARGMSGTLEQAQYDYAMQQLGRQFAAVMLPITQAFTYLAGQIERRMAALGGTEQNRMMGAIAGAGVGWQLGGVPGAMLGAGLGPNVLGGGGGTGSVAMAALGGAWLGYRVGGPWGAAAGAAVGGGVAATNSSDWQRLREGGSNKFEAALQMGILGLTDLGHAVFSGRNTEGNPADRVRREIDADNAARRAAAGGPPGAPPPRREVTPFTAAMEDAGGAYFRMQESMIRATAGSGYEDGGPLAPLMDLLIKIYDTLTSILVHAGGAPPPPRSAETTR